jgi:cysteinyl-tRNA synthetase
MLMTHYREPIDFSVARLEEALSLWTKWSRVLAEPYKGMPTVRPELIDVLSNDLSTPGAIRLMGRYASAGSRGSLSGSESDEEIEENRHLGAASLAGALALLGIDTAGGMEEREDRVTRQMVESRLAALNAKDFATADRIRNELAEQGIALMDYKDPETGERRTKWEVKR